MKTISNIVGLFIHNIIRGAVIGIFVGTAASSHGAPSVVFSDDFDGPDLNPLWAGELPVAPGSYGSYNESYVGFPNYQFQSLGTDSVLCMSNSLSDYQRVGWSLNTNFNTSDFCYQTRFNTLIQSPSTSIDSFVEIWVLDAANSNRYDVVALFGGSYGSDRRFLARSSISSSLNNQAFAYQDNTFYRLVLQGSSTNTMRASLYDDQGNELVGYDLGHNTSAFPKGFKIAISQSMSHPLGTYPSAVAIDYVLLTTANAISLVGANSTPGVQVSWPSEVGRWYQLQIETGSGRKAVWVDFGSPLLGNGSDLSAFIPTEKKHLSYRVELLP